MKTMFLRELKQLGLPSTPSQPFPTGPIQEHDLASYPAVVQRYMQFMRVVGRPQDWSLRVHFQGLFRRSLKESWMKCDAWQYNTALDLTRIFYLKLRFFGLIPVVGRDTYQHGRGRMHIKLFDQFTVGDGQGTPYDIGELVTYLNDAILLTPSILFSAPTEWTAIDDHRFGVSLSNQGITVKATVTTNDEGAPINFETTDRFYSDPNDPSKTTRCLWTTPVEGFQQVQGRMVPTRAKAIWHTPQGELPYADFTLDPNELAYNIAP